MKPYYSLLAAWLAMVAVATAACAGSAEPRLTVQDAWARPAAMAAGGAGGMSMAGSPGPAGAQPAAGPTTSAIYFVLMNQGRAEDALVEVRTAVAERTEVHETVRDGAMMRMQPVDRIPVPADGRVELKPGGYHVMLMGLKQALQPGMTIDVTLRFQKSPEQTIRAQVREP